MEKMPLNPYEVYALTGGDCSPPDETCDECGCDLYEGEDVYDFDGWLVCDDCLRDYAKQFRREVVRYEPDYDDVDD